MNYQQRIEHARQILEYNRYRIYHLPARFENLNMVLQHSGIRETLLKILCYIKNKEIFIYRRKYVFFLDNDRITKIRGKTTASVSNRYINYLCAVGFINKQYQNLGAFGDMSTTKLTDINLGFLLDTGSRRPINTFYFRNYSDHELERLDSRAGSLLNSKITPGNISFNMLSVNGCRGIANEVYYSNDKDSVLNKERRYKGLVRGIDGILAERGYTTKQEVIEALKIDCREFEWLYKIYRADFKSRYSYKAPGRIERELYNIACDSYKWIITRRNTDVTNTEDEKNKTGTE